MQLPTPVNNNVLIETTTENPEVSRAGATGTDDRDADVQTGIVLAVSFTGFHLTASAAMVFPDGGRSTLQKDVLSLIGKTVRWEQFAEGGQTFQKDGKTYALVPWWRLISVEDTPSET